MGGIASKIVVPLRGSANGNRYSPTGREVKTGVTRQLIDVTNPKPELIDMRDIARSLARQERYTGHCPLRPTVARHSVAVLHIAARLMAGGYWASGRESDWAPKEPGHYTDAMFTSDVFTMYQPALRAALMHDAPEYLISDVNGATKRSMRPALHGAAARGSGRDHSDSAFDKLETIGERVIARRFACALGKWDALVHKADLLSVDYEMTYDNWEPQIEPAAWLIEDHALARIYGLYAGRNRPVSMGDGGEAMFLDYAHELGMVSDVD